MCRRHLCVITIIMLIISYMRAGVFVNCERVKREIFGNRY